MNKFCSKTKLEQKYFFLQKKSFQNYLKKKKLENIFRKNNFGNIFPLFFGVGANYEPIEGLRSLKLAAIKIQNIAY
jgi:hypothetical protein